MLPSSGPVLGVLPRRPVLPLELNLTLSDQVQPLWHFSFEYDFFRDRKVNRLCVVDDKLQLMGFEGF